MTGIDSRLFPSTHTGNSPAHQLSEQMHFLFRPCVAWRHAVCPKTLRRSPKKLPSKASDSARKDARDALDRILTKSELGDLWMGAKGDFEKWKRRSRILKRVYKKQPARETLNYPLPIEENGLNDVCANCACQIGWPETARKCVQTAHCSTTEGKCVDISG